MSKNHAFLATNTRLRVWHVLFANGRKVPTDAKKFPLKKSVGTFHPLASMFLTHQLWLRLRHARPLCWNSFTQQYDELKRRYIYISKYYNANKNRAITLDNLIKKHGETMGHSIYDQYVAKQRKNGKTLEYFVEKYGEVEGTNIYDEIGKRKSMTYDGFLLRNDGDVEISTNQFEEYCKRRYNSTVSIRGVSKSSQDFFTKLHAEILKIGLDGIYYSSFNTEWGINIVGKRYVYLDFFVRSKGKVIEFYGDYYHANPKKFKSGDVIKSYGELKNVDRIWMDDFQRIKDIKSVPYIKDVMVIWSSDVESDEKEILQKCVKFLIE